MNAPNWATTQERTRTIVAGRTICGSRRKAAFATDVKTARGLSVRDNWIGFNAHI